MIEVVDLCAAQPVQWARPLQYSNDIVSDLEQNGYAFDGRTSAHFGVGDSEYVVLRDDAGTASAVIEIVSHDEDEVVLVVEDDIDEQNRLLDALARFCVLQQQYQSKVAA